MKTSSRKKLKIVVLQHPQEPGVDISTVPLISELFSEVTVKVGLSWPNLKKVLGEEGDSKRWGVLYLGSVRKNDLPQEMPLVAVDSKGIVLKDSRQRVNAIEGVIVLDGTWSQAKTLWWRNAWLLKCTRIVLNPKNPSLYDAIRKEPRTECLSSVESLAMALSSLEGDNLIESSVQERLAQFVSLHRSSGTSRKRRPSPGRRPRRDFRRKKASVNKD